MPKRSHSSVIEYTSLRYAAMNCTRSFIGSVSFQGMAHLLMRRTLPDCHRCCRSKLSLVYPVCTPPVRKTGGHVKDFQGRMYRRGGLFVASGRDGMGLKKSQQ